MTQINVGFILRLAAVHALAVFVLALPAYAEWEDYQYETFDSTETIFPTGTFGEAAYSVDSQGRYIVNGMESSVDSLAAINDSNSFYRVSADCQILSSTAGELAFCGLIFHYGKRPADDKVSYYVFYVYGDGFYGVKRIINGGKSDVIIPLANTDLLAPGEPNTLAIEARGNRFELFINGQPVNEFTDMKIDGGGYGLYISKHSIGAFDEFEVLLEPAPLKRQTEVQRSEGRGGIKPLSIPRNPDRPLYPWEVGYDKDPKKKKRRIQQEQGGGETRPAEEPKKPAKKPAAKPKKTAAKPTDELQRNTTSRSADKGFVADHKPAAKPPEEPASKEAAGGTSLRDQYKQTKGEEPAPRKPLKREPPKEDPIEEVAPAVEEAAPVEAPSEEPSPAEVPDAGVALEDQTVTDTGEALPEAKSGEEEILYRRDPKFDEDQAEAHDEPEAKKLAASDKPVETGKRKRGLDTGGDDWDSGPRKQYEPKKRLPKAKPEEKAVAKPAPEPVEATASNGSKVKVETLPLDGPLADPELESESAADEPALAEEQPLDTTAPLQEEAEAAIPEPVKEPETVKETAESPFPALDLPEVPSEPEENEPAPSEEPEPFTRPGQVEINDDFTSQQLWNTQELPTSSYRYAAGGYAIDNTKAQTMAISFQQDTFADINIAVDAKHTAGADYVGYGLASRFRVGKDANGRTVISYYGVFISLSGEFMLLKVVDGQETVLKDWGLSPLINLSNVNRLELRVDGSTITALINGREAATVSDYDLTSGGYALLAGPGIAASFDNLTLTGVRQ